MDSSASTTNTPHEQLLQETVNTTQLPQEQLQKEAVALQLEKHSISIVWIDDTRLLDRKPGTSESIYRPYKEGIELHRRLVNFSAARTKEDDARVSQLVAAARTAENQRFLEAGWETSVNEKEVFAELGIKRYTEDDKADVEKLACIPGPPFSRKCKDRNSSGLTGRSPDHLFGFPSSKKTRSASKDLGQDFLDCLEAMSFVTTPIVSDRDLYFPWGVHEAKSGLVGKHTQAAYYVYVQVACGVAICMDILIWLSMIHEPVDDASEVDQEFEADSSKGNIPPMLAFTSVGPIWDVFICYKYANKTIVSRVWTGDITKHNDAFKLLHIVDEARAWALDTFRPWVVEKLEICHRQLAPLLRTLEKANKRKVAPSPKPEKTQSMKPKKAQSTTSEKLQPPKPKKTQPSKPKKTQSSKPKKTRTPHSNSHSRRGGSKTKALADRKEDPLIDTNPHSEREVSKTELIIDSKEDPVLNTRSNPESGCLKTEVAIDGNENLSIDTDSHLKREASKTEIVIDCEKALSIDIEPHAERESSKAQAIIDRKEDPPPDTNEDPIPQTPVSDCGLRANDFLPNNMTVNKELCCGHRGSSSYWQFAWMWILIALIHSCLYGGLVGSMQSGAGFSLEHTVYPMQQAKLPIAYHPEPTRELGLWRLTGGVVGGGDVCCGYTGSFDEDGTPSQNHQEVSTHDFAIAAFFFDRQVRVPPSSVEQSSGNKPQRPGKWDAQDRRRLLVTYRVLSPTFGMLRRKSSLDIPSYDPLQGLEYPISVDTRLRYPIFLGYDSKCTISDRSGIADHTPLFTSYVPSTVYAIQPDGDRTLKQKRKKPYTLSGTLPSSCSYAESEV